MFISLMFHMTENDAGGLFLWDEDEDPQLSFAAFEFGAFDDSAIA